MKEIFGKCNIKNCLEYNLSIERIGTEKFESEYIHYESDEYVILLQGVVLNLEELKEEFHILDPLQLIIQMWKKYGKSTGKYLKGSYFLNIIDKRNRRFFLVNDRLSKSHIYYTVKQSYLYYSNNFLVLVQKLKEENHVLSIDSLGMISLISKGQLIDNLTVADGIMYLQRDEFLSVIDGKYSKGLLDKSAPPISENLDTILEELDHRFSSSLNSQLNKNFQHNFRQLFTLSGGMDTRSVILYARNLGCDDFTTFTYAQRKSVDDDVSSKIAYDLHAEHIFFSLDYPKMLYFYDRLCELNQCQYNYVGATGAYQTVQMLDCDGFGIVHTGSLGGELLSDIFSEPAYTSCSSQSFSKEFKGFLALHRDDSERLRGILDQYDSFEDYKLINHTRACQNFSDVVKEKVIGLSPFMHEDFYYYVDAINPSLRYRRELYRRWMKKFINNDYLTTYNKSKISSNKYITALNETIDKFGRKLTKKTKFDMNPFDFWFSSLPQMHESINRELKTRLDRLEGSSEIEMIKTAYRIDSLRPLNKLNLLTGLIAAEKIL